MPRSVVTRLLRISGAAAVGMGLLAMASGSLWAPRALDLIYSGPISWPFDALLPFMPIFAISLGALLLVKSRR
jgi:hypothetical protein